MGQGVLVLDMAGGHKRHLEEFGMCECGSRRSGVEQMDFEFQDERTGRWKTERVPACADCFGLL
jgi:hypothetical protein